MNKIILTTALLIGFLVTAQTKIPSQFIPEITESNLDSNVTLKLNSGGVSANTFIPTQASDFTSPNVANIGKIWELTTTIDLGGADVDLSTYGITLKDSGGLITNFRTFDLGDFYTEGNPNATYFAQYDGTTNGYVKTREQGALLLTQPTSIIVSVIGQCLDGIVYVEWFSPHKNADLVSGGTINGALADHAAIQNAMAVTPKTGGTIAFPHNAWLLQGDGTNADYTYSVQPYIGSGNVTPTGEDDYKETNQAFVFDTYDNLTILGNGVTILAHPDQAPIVNNRGFYFFHCDNVIVNNLTYNGNLQQRSPYHGDANPFNNQHGMGWYGCNNPIMNDVIMTDCVMDGFYFGTASGVVGRGGQMNRCKALYNYRQGMSVVTHSEVTVRDCEFSFTGQRLGIHPANLIGQDYIYTITSVGTTNWASYGLTSTAEIGKTFTATTRAAITGTGTATVVYTPHQFTIHTLGNTDWTALGASGTPTVGETFMSTNLGVGSGTGYAYGRYLTTSPSAGIDMEAGGEGTGPDARGQFDWAFYNCKFESNYGDGLANHWGSTKTLVQGCIFIDDSLFEPQDSVEETTGNNTYQYNSFYNSIVQLEAGGAHFIGNVFYIDDFQEDFGLFPPSTTDTAQTSITVIDGAAGSYFNTGYSRRIKVEDNLIKVDVANFPTNTLTVGKIIVTAIGASVKNNRIINAIGVKADLGDNTILSVSDLYELKGNSWLFTADALAKYTGNIGRMILDTSETLERYNTIDNGYSYSSYYDGGERGTTANRPNLTSYDAITDGADYYDTTTGTMVYWNGTAFD